MCVSTSCDEPDDAASERDCRGWPPERPFVGSAERYSVLIQGTKPKNKTGLTCRRSQEADSTRRQAGFNPLFFLACFRKPALGTPARIPPRPWGLGLFAQGRPRSPLPRLRGSRSMLRRALCSLGHPLPRPPLPPTPQGAPVRTRVPSRRRPGPRPRVSRRPFRTGSRTGSPLLPRRSCFECLPRAAPQLPSTPAPRSLKGPSHTELQPDGTGLTQPPAGNPFPPGASSQHTHLGLKAARSQGSC